MSDAVLYCTGHLEKSNHTIPVSVRYASAFSLWLRFVTGRPREMPRQYDRLSFEVDGRTIDTGPCRVISDEKADNGEFRLVPIKSIRDFQKLFFRAKIDTLEAVAANLPLVLSYKRRIKREFADFVSELTYDLSAYRAVFDQIDRRMSDEPVNVQEHLQDGIIDSLGQQLMEYLEQQHTQLRTITANFTDEEHEHHGFFFRMQLWNTILSAPIMARTNTKPRGYIGDSQMMRMIYSNSYEGDSTFGKIVHKHAVNQPAAQAVRNRKSDLVRILNQTVSGGRLRPSESEDRIRVLSIACGPAVEIGEILTSPEQCRKYHFTLLDQDRHALMEAAETTEFVEEKFGEEVSADFVNESVRTMLVTRELQERWGRFDFIYSLGLFDYLTKPVAIALLRKLTHLLLSGGTMVIGNFANENPSACFMAYWMDWPIIYRSQEDMLNLAAKVPDIEAELYRDDSGIQMFLELRKKRPHE